MANVTDFGTDLKFSRGSRETTDLATIQRMIPGCVNVEKTGEDLDRMHVDYVAYLRAGAVLHIDGKTRREGASKFWHRRIKGRGGVADGEPDVAIELWSVRPNANQNGKAGWTFDESSDTDLILYTFDPSDTNEVILLSFPLLRMATRLNYRHWVQLFTVAVQDSGRWKSECVLVPACVVQESIRDVERNKHSRRPNETQPSLPSIVEAPHADEIFR